MYRQEKSVEITSKDPKKIQELKNQLQKLRVQANAEIKKNKKEIQALAKKQNLPLIKINSTSALSTEIAKQKEKNYSRFVVYVENVERPENNWDKSQITHLRISDNLSFLEHEHLKRRLENNNGKKEWYVFVDQGPREDTLREIKKLEEQIAKLSEDLVVTQTTKESSEFEVVAQPNTAVNTVDFGECSNEFSERPSEHENTVSFEEEKNESSEEQALENHLELEVSELASETQNINSIFFDAGLVECFSSTQDVKKFVENVINATTSRHQGAQHKRNLQADLTKSKEKVTVTEKPYQYVGEISKTVTGYSLKEESRSLLQNSSDVEIPLEPKETTNEVSFTNNPLAATNRNETKLAKQIPSGSNIVGSIFQVVKERKEERTTEESKKARLEELGNQLRPTAIPSQPSPQELPTPPMLNLVDESITSGLNLVDDSVTPILTSQVQEKQTSDKASQVEEDTTKRLVEPPKQKKRHNPQGLGEILDKAFEMSISQVC